MTHYHQWLYRHYLMAAIDSMQDPVWFKDREGLYWLTNQKFEDTVRKTRSQIHGKDYNFVWDIPEGAGNEAAKRSMDADMDVMKQKETIMTDETLETPSGVIRYIASRSPLYDRAGMVMGTLGIAKEIHENEE